MASVDPVEPSPAPPQAPGPVPAPAAGPIVVPPRRFSVRDFLLGMAAGVFATVLAIGVIVGVATYFLSTIGPDGASFQSAGEPPEFPSGQPLSIFGRADESWTFTTLDGAPATLADFKGKVVFLNFWATWCGPCVAEMPSIARLRDALKDDPVAFVLVSDEARDTIDRFIKKKEWTLTSYRADGDPPAVFESPGIPATYIVNPDGLVVFKHVGMAQWDHESTVAFVRGLLPKAPVK